MSTIIDAMQDQALFARWFRGETWSKWIVFLSALFGLPLGDAQAEIYRKHTGRTALPTDASREAWLVVGRRGGKSLIAALIAVFSACFRDYSPLLAPGEIATIMVIAADRRQARTIMRYISAFLEAIPMLSALVTRQLKESIEFSNRVVIEIHVCNFRTVRGYTLAGVICDEIAFWRSEDSANPDTEIINGLRPGMATIPKSLLLCISSPYARRGALWQAYQKHFGRDGDPILVWQADSLSMNPSLDPSVVEQAFEEDESSASAEYGAEFRRDIESFVARESVDKCVIPARFELPYIADFVYQGFIDPSGGSSDSFTLGIAHQENGRAVLDLLREHKPPFSPEDVCREFSAELKRYHLASATSDRYAGEWVREGFSKNGISITASERSKSEIYLEILPALNSGNIELLDNARLISQLCNLERRTGRGTGRDTVDHGPGSNCHDDLVNSAAGALVLAIGPSEPGWITYFREKVTEMERKEAGVGI